MAQPDIKFGGQLLFHTGDAGVAYPFFCSINELIIVSLFCVSSSYYILHEDLKPFSVANMQNRGNQKMVNIFP